MMGRFMSDVATEASRTIAPLSDAGNRPPCIEFGVSDDGYAMTAHPPMAAITCAWTDENTSDVHVLDVRDPDDQPFIAHVTVHRLPDNGDDLTTETIAIASAIYWSWWRALDMRGEIKR